MPLFVFGALRIAIALIAMSVVPLVTVGLLGTIATSWPPFLLTRYWWATCWAIWLVIWFVEPALGSQADQAAAALWPGFATITANAAIAPTKTRPSTT